MAESSLRNRTVSGVGWSAADAFLGQGVTFLVGIILARLLSPAEYGLIGIVTIFTTILTGIVDSGFSNAVIRKEAPSQDDYDTMFITNLVISIILFVLLYVSSPLIANFFSRQELVSLTRVTGLILIIQAFSLVQNTILTKNINFKTKTKASLISAILSGLIGITMAFTGFGVWALVGQILSKQLIYSVCLWFFNKWKPTYRFSLESFRYMWGFGWKLMISGLLYNIWNQLYQVVVGKFYNANTLGQYSRAKDYAQIFSSNFTMIFQRVTFPVLAEIQNEKERLVAAYRKVIKTSMFVTAITMISLGAVAEPLVYCLIGPQWHQAATFLPYICISLSLYPLHAINLNMLQVQGRSDLYLIIEIIKKIIAIGPLCLGIFVGIYWMLIGTIFTGFVSFFLNSYFSGKKLGYTSFMQLRDIEPSYGVAFIVAMSVFFLKYLPISYWLVLPLQIAVGAFVFFSICKLTNMEEYYEVKQIVVSYIGKFRSKR